MLKDQEIFEIVQSSENAMDGVHRLIEKANEKGGEDNISVVLMMDKNYKDFT